MSSSNADIFSNYAPSIRRFLARGGVIVWGIVPTGTEAFEGEDLPAMIERLEAVWEVLARKGIDRERMLARSLLSPATCCLVNPDRGKTVEKAFAAVRDISSRLRARYRLTNEA